MCIYDMYIYTYNISVNIYAFKSEKTVDFFSPQQLAMVFPKRQKGTCKLHLQQFEPKLRWLLWPELRQFGGF